MPTFPVSPAKIKDLEQRMEALGIHESDLTEEFIRGSGHGGQKINKSSIVVQLTHQPSGISLRCQEGRSQALNRYYARKRLVEKLEAQVLGEASEQQQKIEKIRRQKRKRSKRFKEKMLQEKRIQAEKKQLRQKPFTEE